MKKNIMVLLSLIFTIVGIASVFLFTEKAVPVIDSKVKDNIMTTNPTINDSSNYIETKSAPVLTISKPRNTRLPDEKEKPFSLKKKEHILSSLHRKALLKFWQNKDIKSFFSYIDENNIDINQPLYKDNPLRFVHLAVNMGTDAIDQIIRLNGNIDPPDMGIIKSTIPGDNNLKIFKYLLELPQVNIHRLDQQGNNNFSFAIKLGKDEKAKLLLEKGIDFRHVNNFGEDAMDALSKSSKGKVSTYNILFNLGFTPNINHIKNQIIRGNVLILMHLQDNGANLHFIDENANNAMDIAFSSPSTEKEVIEYLYNQGFEITQKHLERVQKMAIKYPERNEIIDFIQDKVQ